MTISHLSKRWSPEFFGGLKQKMRHNFLGSGLLSLNFLTTRLFLLQAPLLFLFVGLFLFQNNSFAQKPRILNPQKLFNPDSIWLDGSGVREETTLVVLKATTTGEAETLSLASYTDVLLSIDGSQSMHKLMSNGLSKYRNAKNTAQAFVAKILGGSGENRVAVHNWFDADRLPSPELWDRLPFTADSQLVADFIEGIRRSVWTPLWDAIGIGTQYVSENFQTDNLPVIILLTDGIDDSLETTNSTYHFNGAAGKVNLVNYIDSVHKATGTIVYTIGFAADSSEVNAGNLRTIAAAGGGRYFYAPDPVTLQNIYDSIANDITQLQKIVAGETDTVNHTQAMIFDILPGN